MRLYLGSFLLPMLLRSTLVQADAVTLTLGRPTGDMTPDQHRYARSYQDKMFKDQKLQGTQAEAAWHLAFKPIGRFTSAWVFGLGHVNASIEDSYSGGTLKLARSTTFIHGGFRVMEEQWVPSLRLGLELITMKGLDGKVTLSAPTGKQTKREDHNIMDIGSPYLGATAGYRITPFLS
ncbi:MAG: hypothetical protein M3Q07_13200, partial [Pseudobdellovibrionaceae bacterium]|nr:hypothetical protein [Pseudobdellovibrionaceae bacterium]